MGGDSQNTNVLPDVLLQLKPSMEQEQCLGNGRYGMFGLLGIFFVISVEWGRWLCSLSFVFSLKHIGFPNVCGISWIVHAVRSIAAWCFAAS